MAQILSVSTGEIGLEISINYNEANLRITTVDWAVPASGTVARVRLWNAGVLFYDRTVAGPASGAESVPGNHSVVLVNEPPFGEYYDLPAYITYTINIETIGA